MTVMITMKMTPTTLMMTRSKAMLPIMRGDSRRHCEGGRGSHSACFRNPACEAFTVGTKREPTHPPTWPPSHPGTFAHLHKQKTVANTNKSRKTNTDTVANRNTNQTTHFATKPPWPSNFTKNSCTFCEKKTSLFIPQQVLMDGPTFSLRVSPVISHFYY